MPWNLFINFMCGSHTDVIAALVMNAQNMDEKIVLIFSLSVIPINRTNQIIKQLMPVSHIS